MFQLKGVSFFYSGASGAGGGGISVDDLTIKNGAVTAIIGPSGSGKTTLLSVLAGFVRPEVAVDGNFAFNGVPITAPGHPTGRVAFVFQSPMLLGAANGVTNALQGHFAKTANYALPLAQARSYAQRLGLIHPDRASLLAKRARLLSGGEAQRLSILRALLAEPEIILCDEPTSSLDERNAQLAMGALREWSDTQNRAVVWVTHNLDQAAEYADDYIFVSKGTLFRPDPEDAEGLSDDDSSRRLTALRRINAKLIGETDRPDTAASKTTAPEPEGTTRHGTFVRWMAKALSTDGLGIDSAEAQQSTLVADAPMVAALEAIEGRPAPQRPGAPAQFWQKVKRYSRYSAGLTLAFMLLQIFVASMIGDAARTYAEEQLNNPSVARLVFELFIEDQSEAEIAEMQLFPQRLRDLEAIISEALPDQATQDRAVQIYVRRTLASSRIQFETPNPNCNVWRPLETNVLNRGDPLVTQAALTGNFPNLTHDMNAVLDRASERARALAAGTEAAVPAVALIDRRFVDVLVARCDVDPAAGPIIVTWDTGLNRTIPLELVAAWDERPPLYPGLPEMIVFEDEYQASLQLLDRRRPDPPRVATAYFPISAFGIAEAVLAGEGYRIRDDSASAVESLQQIETVAVTAPRLVAMFALVVSVAVIAITISSVLEINKRVLALFVALGMQRRALIAVFVRHLAPALIFAALLAPTIVAVLVALAWWQYGSDLEGLLALSQIAWAYGQSISALVVVTTSATVAVILVWWRHTRGRLKTYLQE